MTESNGPVSVAILTLLSFISIALAGYLSLYCYTHFKSKLKRSLIDLPAGHWLDHERKPLIPGNIHAQTVQPVPSNSDDLDEEDCMEEFELSFKERPYTKLGRIIFVMRYNKKREELMVRLVQIEGMPVSQDLYSPNSAYVDVQLKYTGDPDDHAELEPPRLDICLQQVYYFIISIQQMMSHSLEFQVNTFDDQFRRYVSGVVEVNLSEEMGDDILTGSEVVFVKEIFDPFKVSNNEQEEHYVSAMSEQLQESFDQQESFDHQVKENTSRRSSRGSSNMSWEPESKELISLSTNSLYFRCNSEQDLSMYPLTDFKRSHSVGYLPTHEWTIKDIPLDDDEGDVNTPVTTDMLGQLQPDTNEKIDTTPESFYHIVPITPLLSKDYAKPELESSLRRVAYKKQPKRKQFVRRSLTINKHSNPRVRKTMSSSHASLDRSSSWPSLVAPLDMDSSNDVTPEHLKFNAFFADR